MRLSFTTHNMIFFYLTISLKYLISEYKSHYTLNILERTYSHLASACISYDADFMSICFDLLSEFFSFLPMIEKQ